MAVYGAYAYPQDARGYLFHLGAADRIDYRTAVEFLLSVPGRPKVVIADGSGVWRKAVAAAWPPITDDGNVVPTPRFLRCQWHVGQTLRSQLRASGVLPPRIDERSDSPPYEVVGVNPGTGAATAADQRDGKVDQHNPERRVDDDRDEYQVVEGVSRSALRADVSALASTS